MRNVAYLDSLGISGGHVMLAHCIHLSKEEMEILGRTKTNVAHCPSSNLKLGSGVARVAEMLARKISVSLGADGAACNNRLDMFTEMRTAALLQKLAHGPEILPATQVLRMQRRKICRFCIDKVDYIDFKDVKLLQSYTPERGKILPRRISGVCATHQRMLAEAIKRARNIAFLPYAAD